MRLRLIDLKTPWFWLVVFYRQAPYGKPWLECSVFSGIGHKRWWWCWWQWEQEPERHGSSAPSLRREDGTGT